MNDLVALLVAVMVTMLAYGVMEWLSLVYAKSCAKHRRNPVNNQWCKVWWRKSRRNLKLCWTVAMLYGIFMLYTPNCILLLCKCGIEVDGLLNIWTVISYAVAFVIASCGAILLILGTFKSTQLEKWLTNQMYLFAILFTPTIGEGVVTVIETCFTLFNIGVPTILIKETVGIMTPILISISMKEHIDASIQMKKQEELEKIKECRKGLWVIQE